MKIYNSVNSINLFKNQNKNGMTNFSERLNKYKYTILKGAAVFLSIYAINKIYKHYSTPWITEPPNIPRIGPYFLDVRTIVILGTFALRLWF